MIEVLYDQTKTVNCKRGHSLIAQDSCFVPINSDIKKSTVLNYVTSDFPHAKELYLKTCFDKL